MDVEEFNNCGHDYTQVLDGNNINAPEIGKYCGTVIPPPITSQGAALTLNFVSDSSDQRSGFRAVYTKSISCKLKQYLIS